MSFTFLITARLKSKRLKKKLLLPIKNVPIIVHMINRIKLSKEINRIILCTSNNSSDDPLEAISKKEKIFCFRGSENDVLQRLLDAASIYQLKSFANMTADSPLIDPILIDKTVKYFNNKGDIDLLLPAEGSLCGCKVVNVSALESICNDKRNNNTEVWNNYFVRHGYNVKTFNLNKNLIRKNFKTSLDYIEDYKMINEVFSELYDNNPSFSSKDIIKLITTKPHISNINSSKNMLIRWRNHINKVTNIIYS